MNNISEDILSIDKYNLDEEWVKQAKIYGSVAKKLARAKRRYAEAKAEHKVIEADLELKIRKRPEHYLGEVRLTESSVEKAIKLQKEFQESENKLIQASYTVDLLQGMIDSLDHKKKALGDLVSLFIGDYFSEPKPNNNAAKEVVSDYQKKSTRSKTGVKKRRKK